MRLLPLSYFNSRSTSELHEFNRILASQNLIEIASKVDEVNPKQKEALTAASCNV